jgi:hypothetical protein
MVPRGSQPPPSLQFMSVTVGLSMLLLAMFDAMLSSGRSLWLRKTVEIYGRVPFLYYIAHLGLIHLMAIVVCTATGHDWHRFVAPLPNNALMMGGPSGYGYGLPMVYLLWLLFVLTLFWPMKLYADYRKAYPEKWWLSYL